mmetsp:Transcript_7410/g.11229  ORF Transcript_7410/g.11229 Transcript_7410/m.11229 type:complete len:1254 (-) Transcript_7410:179-3940(-)|eukprot:CAMPEP_0167761194 /NCGR_PEP_ID=MMETSP0110_2-20121227/12029_1 /TAXON_ID=629695 /ORGANISM="Gymnochlora sp., Strain CCMP2014" /LENGTH=1253 /DNA_ID=CAMNT_0007647835 /DNA_START=177 /DNA_END=3938 /DNA_ORIENTATION=+
MEAAEEQVAGARPITRQPKVTNGGKGLLDAKVRHDLVYLHSQPLIYHGPDGQIYDVEPLNFSGEKDKLFRTLKEAGRALRIRAEAATTENLRKLVTLGCRALHYTGHGLPNSLVFEDGSGGCHMLIAKDLKKLFGAGGGGGVQFVFVAACHSEAAGRAFLAAGVKHVIAVRLEAKVADQSPAIFMNQFYLALLVGHTIQEAFDIGQNAVDGSPDVYAKADSSKFLLLPEKANHNIKIFNGVPKGSLIDLSIEKAPSNIGAAPEGFIGRNYEIEHMMRDLTGRPPRRLVTLTGPNGIGKTATAITAANYMHERGCFPDGVISIDVAAVRGKYPALSPSDALMKGVRDSLLEAGILDPSKDSKSMSVFEKMKTRNMLLVFDDIDSTPPKTAQTPTPTPGSLIFSTLSRLAGSSPAPLWPAAARPFLSKLLSVCPRVKVLCTARVPLQRIDGSVERVISIPPLSKEYTLRLLLNLLGNPSSDRKEASTRTGYRGVTETVLRGHKLMLLIQNHPARVWDAARAVVRAHGSLDKAAKAMQARRASNTGIWHSGASTGSSGRRDPPRRSPHSQIEFFVNSLLCGPTQAKAKEAIKDYLPVDLSHITNTSPKEMGTPRLRRSLSEEEKIARTGHNSHRVIVCGFEGGNKELNGIYTCVGIASKALFLEHSAQNSTSQGSQSGLETNSSSEGDSSGRKSLVYRAILDDGTYGGTMIWQYGDGWCIGPKTACGSNMCVAVLPASPLAPWLVGASQSTNWYVSVGGEQHIEQNNIFVVPDIDVSVTGCTGSNAGLNGVYRLSREHAKLSFASRYRIAKNRPVYIQLEGGVPGAVIPPSGMESIKRGILQEEIPEEKVTEKKTKEKKNTEKNTTKEEKTAEKKFKVKNKNDRDDSKKDIQLSLDEKAPASKYAIWCCEDGWCIGRQDDIGSKRCFVCSSKSTPFPYLDEGPWQVVALQASTSSGKPPHHTKSQSDIVSSHKSLPLDFRPTMSAGVLTLDHAKQHSKTPDPKKSSSRTARRMFTPPSCIHPSRSFKRASTVPPGLDTPKRKAHTLPREKSSPSTLQFQSTRGRKGYWKHDSNVTVVARCGVIVQGGTLNSGEGTFDAKKVENDNSYQVLDVNGRYALCEEVLLLPYFARRRFRNRPVYQKVDRNGNRINVFLWCCGEGWVLGPHLNLGTKVGAAACDLDNPCPWFTSQAWERWVTENPGMNGGSPASRSSRDGSGRWRRDPSMVLLPLSGCVGLAAYNEQGAPIPSPKVIFAPRK